MHVLSTLLFFFLLLVFFSFFYSELIHTRQAFYFATSPAQNLFVYLSHAYDMYTYVESRGQPQVLFLKSHSPNSLRQNLWLVSQEHTIDWLASEPQALAVFSSGIVSTHHHVLLFTGCWGSSSDPHACTSTLLTELSVSWKVLYKFWVIDPY